MQRAMVLRFGGREKQLEGTALAVRGDYDARLQRQPTEPAPAGPPRLGPVEPRLSPLERARDARDRPPVAAVFQGLGHASTSNGYGSRGQDGGLAGLPPR